MKHTAVHIKGVKVRLLKGGALLLDGGHGHGASYSSVAEMQHETRGSGLTNDALRRLEKLKPKPLSDGKRPNIRFSI